MRAFWMAMRSQETRPGWEEAAGRLGLGENEGFFFGSRLGCGGEYLVGWRKGIDWFDFCGLRGCGIAWSYMGLPNTLENGIDELEFWGRSGAGMATF